MHKLLPVPELTYDVEGKKCNDRSNLQKSKSNLQNGIFSILKMPDPQCIDQLSKEIQIVQKNPKN